MFYLFLSIKQESHPCVFICQLPQGLWLQESAEFSGMERHLEKREGELGVKLYFILTYCGTFSSLFPVSGDRLFDNVIVWL